MLLGIDRNWSSAIERALSSFLCAGGVEKPYFQLFCDGMDGPGASAMSAVRMGGPAKGSDMSTIAIIGLDIAKNVFQVHGAASDGAALIRRQIRRGQVLTFFANLPPCVVALEACFTAHFWAREIVKFGHEVRMIPPQYVKPFVKRNKTDSADAEAICEVLIPVEAAHQNEMMSPAVTE